MSETTHIEWATHTASPWFGCSKVSAGCTNCYAEALTLRNKWAGWGDNSPRVRSKGFWAQAYKWNAQAEGAKGLDRPRMFTSLMDWLDPHAPIEWLADFLKVIYDCENLDWLLLTKRPELWRGRIEAAICYLEAHAATDDPIDALCNWLPPIGIAPRNVWFGVTAENQEMADLRIPQLLKIPARVRWLSVEPLLSPIQFGAVPGDLVSPIYQNRRVKVDWVVVGGESGPKRRDCGVDAIVSVAQQCGSAGVPVFVKQDTAFKPGQQGRIPDHIWKLKEYPV